MGESKHTPGPWAIPVANVFRVVAPHAPREKPVDPRAYPWPVVADTDPQSTSGGEAAANARLIAAAPELLEAAKGLLQLIGHGSGGPFEPRADGTYNERVEALFKAVDTAEGRAP